MAFVQLPRSDVLLGLFVAISCHLLPVFISCLMYLALMLNRKKMLNNRVNPGPVESANNDSVVADSLGKY